MVLLILFQFMSSYFMDSLHIAFRLESKSDSIIRSSVSFCLSASSIAPSSALEFDACSFPWDGSFSTMFHLFPLAYYMLIPALVFSHLLWTADPSVFIVTWMRLEFIASFIFAGGFSGWYWSLFLDLCPCVFPKILILPRMSWFILVSGLYRTDKRAGSHQIDH